MSRSKRLFCMAVLGLLGACASGGPRVSSVPDGAELLSLSGESLGKTPFVLGDESVSKLSENGIMSFKVSAPGHLSRVVILDPSVSREVNVLLPPVNETSFQSDVSRDYAQDLNRMLRAAFSIQKLVQAKKFEEARALVENFQKSYPGVAYGHVVSAQMALIEGRRDEARVSLLRAEAMDPEDADLRQSLKMLGSKPKSAGSEGAAP